MYVNNEESYYLKSLCEMQYNLWLNNQQIFKKLFEEGLQIQKQRLRDLRNYAKEKRNEEKRQHQNELDSMENHYKDQFSLLAEAISQERQELKVRQKFQAQVIMDRTGIRRETENVIVTSKEQREYKENASLLPSTWWADVSSSGLGREPTNHSSLEEPAGSGQMGGSGLRIEGPGLRVTSFRLT